MQTSSNALGEKLRGARKRLGLTQKMVGDQIGVTRATVCQWELGKETPGRQRLLAVANFFKLPLDLLCEGNDSSANFARKHHEQGGGNDSDSKIAGPKSNPTFNMGYPSEVTRVARAVDPLSLRQMPQTVPVFGTEPATNGGDGDFLLTSVVVEHARRTQGIQSAGAVFALWVGTETMKPAFMLRDLIYCHPGRPPRIGDMVLIELHPEGDSGGNGGGGNGGDGNGGNGNGNASNGNGNGNGNGLDGEADVTRPALIRCLTAITDSEIEVEQYNPAKQTSIPRSRVRRMSLILRMADVVGM